MYCVLMEIRTHKYSIYFSLLFIVVTGDEVSVNFLRWEPEIWVSGKDTRMPQATGYRGLVFPILQQNNPTPEIAPHTDSYFWYPWLAVAYLRNNDVLLSFALLEVGFLKSALHETLEESDGKSSHIHLRNTVGWQTC